LNRPEETERIEDEKLAVWREKGEKIRELAMKEEAEKRRKVESVSEEDERWRNRFDLQEVSREGRR